MLRIAIDAHMVGERETGNETYMLGLLQGLAQIDRHNRYFVLVTDPASLRSHVDLPSNFKAVPVRPAMNAVRVSLAMPWIAHRLDADVLHVTYIAPPVSPCAVVVTVHDISFKIFPRFFSWRDRLLLSTFVPLSMRQAAYVIAVSECTKSDIITHYRLHPERVAVTLEAPDARFSPVKDVVRLQAMREKYGLSEEFILTVGNVQPRKNLEVLISAIAVLKSRGMLTAQLAIVGQSHWRAHKVLSYVREAGLGGDVRFLGYVPDEDLPGLYSAARVFAFPSLYEGFGLPPLEAMACGTPVVSSNSGALREVIGDAGLLLPPRDVMAWVDALQALLGDSELRDDLSRRGLAHAARFSWRDTARKTLRIYKQAAGVAEGGNP
jgi:glycosyltransferase involved in cell wall biosynthesis